MPVNAEKCLHPHAGFEFTTSTTPPSAALSVTSTNCATETTPKKMAKKLAVSVRFKKIVPKFRHTKLARKTFYAKYSRTSMARTPMAILSCPTRTCSWVPLIPYMRLLWSNFCIYGFMLLFSFSILVTAGH